MVTIDTNVQLPTFEASGYSGDALYLRRQCRIVRAVPCQNDGVWCGK